MYKAIVTLFLLVQFNLSFGQELVNTGSYTDFVVSLGKCIVTKNTAEIKKSFLVLPNGKLVAELNHEELYYHTDRLYQNNNNGIINFGKLLQMTPKKVYNVTASVNKKTMHRFDLTIEKALKIYLNSNSNKPHLSQLVIILYKGKWYLVDY